MNKTKEKAPVFLELCPICRRSGKLECKFVNEVNELIARAETQEEIDALPGMINKLREGARWEPCFCKHTNYDFDYPVRRE